MAEKDPWGVEAVIPKRGRILVGTFEKREKAEAMVARYADDYEALLGVRPTEVVIVDRLT